MIQLRDTTYHLRVDTLRALYLKLDLKLTPELKEIQISPIQGHADIMKL